MILIDEHASEVVQTGRESLLALINQNVVI